jgi:hypothetical protein
MQCAQEDRVGLVLPSGAFAIVRRAGSHAGDPRCTIHLVDFWRSEADFKAGKPYWRRCDFFHHCAGPMDDPAAALIGAFDQYVMHPDNAWIEGDHSLGSMCPWRDKPDHYGTLAHRSMKALKVTPE